MGKIINSILALTSSLLIGGLFVYKLYYWFALPVFTSLPSISYPQAIGLSLFLSVFKTTYLPLKDDLYDIEDIYIRAWFLPIIYLAYLGASYIVHLFI